MKVFFFIIVLFSSCSSFKNTVDELKIKNCNLNSVGKSIDSIVSLEYEDSNKFKKSKFELDSIYYIKYEDLTSNNKTFYIEVIIDKYNCSKIKTLIRNH